MKQQANAPAEQLGTTLTAIVGHPLRARCLALLAEATLSPKQIADRLGAELDDVSYHVRTLKRLGAVELVGQEPVRGAVRHIYRAVERPMVSDEQYARLPAAERLEFSGWILELSLAESAVALDSGSFAKRHDHHVSRFPARVDEQGWRDIAGIYNRALREAMKVAAASATRISRDPSRPSIDARITAAVFEMPGS
ncbi:MAG: helix-turn-helix domain-containing protein [Solirubrobacterales bacterium]